ncbi:MAG: hypothetical protein ACW97V_18120 [Promethearchaeota archaeon]
MSDSWLYPEQKDREKEYENRCNEIIEQVKRHVDNIGAVHIDFDSEYSCEYCGSTWEEDENGMPMCCDEAQIEATTKTKER